MLLVKKGFFAVLFLFLLTGCFPSFDAEAEKHFYNGIEYIKQENDDLAVDEFTKAIQLDPEYYFAYYNRALILFRIGELDRILLISIKP